MMSLITNPVRSLSKRQRSIVTSSLGIIQVSPDATLVILMGLLGASDLVIIFWKTIGKGLLFLPIIWHVNPESFSGLIKGKVPGFRYIFWGSVLQGVLDFAIPISFVETSVARALLYYSLNPLWSAIMGKVFLKDEIPYRTKVALVSALIAVLITFAPAFIPNSEPEKGVTVRGDIMAFLCGMFVSAYFTLIRLAKRKDPKIDPLPCNVGGSIVAAAAGGVWFLASGTSTEDIFSHFSKPMFVLFVFGPFVAFFVFGDVPSPWTIAGGILILITLVAHEVASFLTKEHIVTAFKTTGRKLSRSISFIAESGVEAIVSSPKLPAKLKRSLSTSHLLLMKQYSQEGGKSPPTAFKTISIVVTPAKQPSTTSFFPPSSAAAASMATVSTIAAPPSASRTISLRIARVHPLYIPNNAEDTDTTDTDSDGTLSPAATPIGKMSQKSSVELAEVISSSSSSSPSSSLPSSPLYHYSTSSEYVEGPVVEETQQEVVEDQVEVVIID
jgi:drug/metabolite transporter (DMT)-like permease